MIAKGEQQRTESGRRKPEVDPREALERLAASIGYRPEDVAAILAQDPDIREWAESHNLAYRKFQPRPDRPEQFDQQTSFVNARDTVSFLIAGNGCLHGDEPIYDPVDGSTLPIRERTWPFYVRSLNPETNRLEYRLASACKKSATPCNLYRFTLDNGEAFTATAFHRVLTLDGWRMILSLTQDSPRLCPTSMVDARTMQPVKIVSHEYVATDVFYDISVPPFDNYEHAGVIHHNSGKTEAAAAKCSKFVLREQPPPRRDTPFWILSDTMEIVTSVAWCEKLLGNGHIPPSEIEWDRISWHDKKQNQPRRVPLKPWPKSRGGDPTKNWCLEFKSYDQGRQAMQARSIGGFWFSEQFPVSLFTEVLVRCRDYLFPGGQFCEFTPLEPDLCLWIESLLEEPPDGWGFYRCNTELNAPNLADGAIDAFMATVSEEMKETRLRGALATFEGAIFTRFNPLLHIVHDEDLQELPPGCVHVMGTDWGASVEHPFVCVLAAVDGVGTWWVYDEYWSIDQNRTTLEHAKAVAEWMRDWEWPAVQVWNQSANQYLWQIRPDAYHGLNYADPSRPGMINDFSTYGIPTGQAINDVYMGIDELRALLKIHPATGMPSLRIAKRCRHLIEEMRKYRWRRARKPTEGTFLNPAAPKPEPLKRDDDTVDALRYAIVTHTRRSRGSAPTAGPDRAPPSATLTRTSGTYLPAGLMPGKRRR